MPPNKTLLPIAVLVAVVALVFWATTRNSSNAPSFAANGAGADGGGYQALVDAQTAQNKRLDRLETMIGRIAARDGVSQATASQEQQGPDLDRMTVAEKQSMQENRRRTTEAAFVFLLSHIGGTLGRSTPFQRTLPDGSVQIIMYSSTTPPRPSGGSHDGH